MRQFLFSWLKGTGLTVALGAASVGLAQEVTTSQVPGMDGLGNQTSKWKRSRKADSRTRS